MPLDRNLSGALSPRSGLLSPEGERRDIADKRSLRNLFENLQEVAKERESAATPPPGMRPPLPPSGNGHQGNGTSVVLVQGRTSPPVPTWGNGIAALALPPDQAVVTVEDLGKSSASDLGAEVSGLIGARKPPVKDKEALRKQAADAMRAVEMRSLTLLEGSMGGPKILRGTPMAANKQHGSCSSLASSSGTAELVLPAKDQPEASAAPLAMATVEETRLE